MATSARELQEQLDEQQDTIDQARETLEDAYTPEATRVELVAAVSDAIDILSGEDTEDTEEGDDEEE